MALDDSIARWIREVKQGDQEAARELWDRYFPQLVRSARQRLAAVTRSIEDEEDVALSALDSFFRGAAKGRFPDLEDRDSLWRLLSWITQRKATDRIRRYRPKGKVEEGRQGASSHEVVGASGDRTSNDRGRQPFPEQAAVHNLADVLTEGCRELLGGLDDPDLQALAVAKLEGYTNEEIAEQHQRSVRTIERRLHLIRRKWERVLTT